jgi:multidrug resistance efflux pump
MVVVAPRDLATLRATTMVEPVVLMDQYDVMQANKQLKAQLAECEKQKAAAYKQCEEQAESISVYELKVRIVFNL